MRLGLRDASHVGHAVPASAGHRAELAAAALVIIAATSLSSVQSRQIPGETVIRRILADVSRSVLGSPPEVDLKFTADASNVSSLVICIVVALFANAAGVGGGSVFVAVFASITQWSVPASVALSQLCITTSALAGSFTCLFQHHPEEPGRPVVNYLLGSFMLPGMLFGVVIGVVLNGWLPGWVTSFTLTFFLVYVAWGSAGKAGKLVEKEHREKGQQSGGDRAEGDQGQDDRLLPEQDQQQQGNGPVPHHHSVYNRVLNWCRLRTGFAWMVAFWAAFMLLEGQKREDLRCSQRYIVSTGCQAALSVAVFVGLLRQVQRQGDGEHKAAKMAHTGAFALIGGIVAGMLGIGGGFVISPLMLSLGAHPSAAAATSNTILFFSSGLATLSFQREGLLNSQFAAIFGGACFLATAVGLSLINKLVQKTGRPSILVILLAALAALGAVLTGWFKGGDAIKDLWHHRNVGLKPFCTGS